MATTRPQQLCCISIGFNDYLMPMDKAMKVMDLMQHAFECNKHYAERGYEYHVEQQPQCGIDMVKPSQVKTPNGEVIPLERKRLTGA